MKDGNSHILMNCNWQFQDTVVRVSYQLDTDLHVLLSGKADEQMHTYIISWYLCMCDIMWLDPGYNCIHSEVYVNWK